MNIYWRPFHRNAFKEILNNSGMVCVSKKAADELKLIMKYKYDDKISYIPNPLTFLPYRKQLDKKNYIVYAGRLFIDKMPLTMIKVWEKVSVKHPDWKFYILGDGPSRNEIEAYISSHKVKNVYLEGIVDNVESYLEESKITILFSYYEGLPTILLEAASYKNALLATISDGGIADIVINNKTGILEKSNVKCLSSALDKLMSDDALVNRYAQEGFDLLKQYKDEIILKKWEQLLCL